MTKRTTAAEREAAEAHAFDVRTLLAQLAAARYAQQLPGAVVQTMVELDERMAEQLDVGVILPPRWKRQAQSWAEQVQAEAAEQAGPEQPEGDAE